MTVAENIKYTYSLTEKIIHSLSEKHSNLQVKTIGKSVMGKSIRALVCGKGEKKVFFNASHHANEWITTPLILKFIDRYLSAQQRKEEICGIDANELFEKKTLVAVPLVNPDGVDLVNGAVDINSQHYINAQKIAAHYPQIPFPKGWKANIEGVDLNLNYPAGWGRAKEIKKEKGITTFAPRDYVGTSPLCAPEARAVYDLTIESGFCLTLSYHTQGKVIYWKYMDYLPQNSEEIAKRLQEASGYKMEITPSESGHAGYKDWFISKYNMPGYTVEAGEGQNPLPMSQFGELCQSNLPLMAQALNLA
ncbi:MAG: gamma-D-glutamyl-meso-diaminopimelate peptidase [Ruminococcaceae bacterium]|nr:gamma-D-glutamyl-meso-diaminopimelate peptidase [Oscillospiraceae bacterium]